MISLKHRQTLSFHCEAFKQDGAVFPLTGFNVSARARLKDSDTSVVSYLIDNGIVWKDQANGTFRIDFDSAPLIPGNYYLFDIKYDNGAVIEYSPTVMIEVKP